MHFSPPFVPANFFNFLLTFYLQTSGFGKYTTYHRISIIATAFTTSLELILLRLIAQFFLATSTHSGTQTVPLLTSPTYKAMHWIRTTFASLILGTDRVWRDLHRLIRRSARLSVSSISITGFCHCKCLQIKKSPEQCSGGWVTPRFLVDFENTSKSVIITV